MGKCVKQEDGEIFGARTELTGIYHKRLLAMYVPCPYSNGRNWGGCICGNRCGIEPVVNQTLLSLNFLPTGEHQRRLIGSDPDTIFLLSQLTELSCRTGKEKHERTCLKRHQHNTKIGLSYVPGDSKLWCNTHFFPTLLSSPFLLLLLFLYIFIYPGQP